ncbi:MAG: ATP-binding protein [candidate division Zixibacteria bacterium]|nr:ATP-binding protein [candidate division Zixibacteria bacterium]
MAVYELIYSSVLESEEPMLDRLQALLYEHSVCDRDARDFMLAVSEAFTNALLHGNRCQPNKEIKVLIDINQKVLCADVIDQGRGGADKVKKKCPSSLLSEGGRGVDLMRYCSTDVKFVEDEKGDLTVSIRLERQDDRQFNK